MKNIVLKTIISVTEGGLCSGAPSSFVSACFETQLKCPSFFQPAAHVLIYRGPQKREVANPFHWVWAPCYPLQAALWCLCCLAPGLSIPLPACPDPPYCLHKPPSLPALQRRWPSVLCSAYSPSQHGPSGGLAHPFPIPSSPTYPMICRRKTSPCVSDHSWPSGQLHCQAAGMGTLCTYYVPGP